MQNWFKNALDGFTIFLFFALANFHIIYCENLSADERKTHTDSIRKSNLNDKLHFDRPIDAQHKISQTGPSYGFNLKK